ncbi:HAMP domain-containing protein [Nocardioides sp. CER19]|uniref:HAMP domain-containing protein n=1 Tax=Nocardioides sp. CER19 TaxID=3038538 RepID=UPI0024497353|nr:HAMP domain-containing protein [Nocardioides sp. CER19]MDH2413932.1 HAMP domain-containing protein [Nocardioides sp. CER19]
MRPRLTVAFLVLGLALCALAFVVRSISLESAFSGDENREIHEAASMIAVAVQVRDDADEPVDQSFLRSLIGDDKRVVLHWDGSPDSDVVAEGPTFTGTGDPSRSDDVWASAEVPGGYVSVSQSEQVVDDVLFGQSRAIVVFFVLLGLCAGVAGFLIARALSRPFRRLADAAGALGRGRFDLDLPRSRVPEVRAISDALRTSATQLQNRLEQEHAFAEQASHLLRTPLTSLRLELEDLALGDQLGPDIRCTVERCVQRIDELDTVTGELVGIARRPGGRGVEVPLRELATTCAQRWADELSHHDRTLTAAVDGDLETTYTAGPLEHIHELLLVDVLHRSRGSVRLVYEATDSGALKLRISAADGPTSRGRSKGPGSTYVRARAVVTALGGRLDGEYHERGLDIVLPRR